MKKIIALTLVIVMLSSMFVSCNETPDDTNDTGTAGPVETAGVDGGDGEETNAPEDTRPYIDQALANYEGLDLTKEEFKILSPSPGQHFYSNSGATENEIYYEEPSSEALPNAIYKRNLEISERLGVDITPIWGGDTSAIVDIVRTNDAAGDKEYYDVILSRIDHMITWASNGWLLNYYDIASMNLEHAWWDKQIVDTFTIYDNYLYALSGDLNYYDDYAVQVMFYNKSLAEGLDDPYELVRTGNWTIDKMLEMCDAVRFDYNGDGVFTGGEDIIGMADNYDAVPHYMFCYGLKMSENDDDGVPQVVWANDTNTAVLDELYTIFTDPGLTITQTWSGFTFFTQDKILFYGEMLGMIPIFRDMESDFGILPMPKGDASMERYNAYVSNGWTTAFAVPSVFTLDEAYETGVILECMSASSKDKITPALYDQLLESKYIRDEESKEMLTYILDSKVYDWAGDLDWAQTLRSAYTNVLTNGPASFTTTLAASEKPLKKQLEKLVANLTGAE